MQRPRANLSFPLSLAFFTFRFHLYCVLSYNSLRSSKDMVSALHLNWQTFIMPIEYQLRVEDTLFGATLILSSSGGE